MDNISLAEQFADVELPFDNETEKKPPEKIGGYIYCSYGHEGESNWIRALGLELTANIEHANVVVFGGGKDVDPGFYGEKGGPSTCHPSERDRVEKEDFLRVQELRKEGKEILIVGVCRGAQLACALSGGQLIQDVGNHCGTHGLSTFDRKEFIVNSIHHQMLYPYKMEKADYKILGWSTKNISSKYLDGWNKTKWLPNNFKEIEVAFFPKTNALAIQSHPEMMFGMAKYKETVEWMQELFLRHYKK